MNFTRACNNWKQGRTPVEKISDIIGLLVAFFGVVTSLRMNLADRSFWVDEAMLAFSFSKRGLTNLIGEAFEMNQSAPVVYLYVCKIISLIFGNTELVLRSVSFVAFILVLMLTTMVAKDLLHIRMYMLPAAMVANINLFLIQANNFKQYMFETATVLAVLYLYYQLIGSADRNDSKKISRNDILFGLILVVSIWCANPAAFLAGGIMTWEFFNGVLKKDRYHILRPVFWGISVAVSFVTYYFVWLKAIASGNQMQVYWEGQAFPLIPTSMQDIKDAWALCYDIFIEFREGRILFMGLLMAGIIVGCFFIKNRYVQIISLTVLVSLVASWIHMFPIANRLWLFSYPLIVLLSFLAVDNTAGVEKPRQLTGLLIMLTAVCCCNGILVYRNPMNSYMAGEELNIPLEYVRENIRPDEQVYVYTGSISGVKYKIGYDTEWIGQDYSNESGRLGNIIWSEGMSSQEDHLNADLEAIIKAGKCYILASHTTEERFMPLIDALQERGQLDVVMSEYATPLYYFTAEGIAE